MTVLLASALLMLTAASNTQQPCGSAPAQEDPCKGLSDAGARVERDTAVFVSPRCLYGCLMPPKELEESLKCHDRAGNVKRQVSRLRPLFDRRGVEVLRCLSEYASFAGVAEEVAPPSLPPEQWSGIVLLSKGRAMRVERGVLSDEAITAAAKEYFQWTP